MDNRNHNRRPEDMYSEQRYSYEQQRMNSQRASAAADARYRAQKRKRIILLSVLGAVLILLWLVAAIAIVKAVFADDTSDDPNPDMMTSAPDTDPAPDTDGGSSVDIPYITVSMEQGSYKTGELILVNADHKYDQAQDKNLFATMGTVADYYNHSYIVVETDKLRRTLIDAMNDMFGAAHAQGLSNYYFGTPYGWCSAAQQALDYADAKTKYPADYDMREFAAGESEHETGYAFDIKVRVNGKLKFISAAGEEYKWIYDNCYKYGIIYRYPADKTEQTGVSIISNTIHYDHFRYVGKAAAAAMHDNNWCLEEFIDNIVNYTYDGEYLSVTGADGVAYEMYYFPAQTEGTTEVRIPEGIENYSISGDNVGGYIVTLTIG